MKISTAFPSEYLKGSDLNGRPSTVTISHVEMAEVGQTREEKPILYFQGSEKGMVLNKTNSSKIAECFGDNTDDWAGQEIILFETTVDFQGKTVPAIRVRLAPRKIVKDSIDDVSPVSGFVTTKSGKTKVAKPARPGVEAGPGDPLPF